MHKLDLSLLDDFSRALIEVAHVMQFGATKYERGSWLGMKPSEMRPSLLRHDMKHRLGEEYDEESDLLHLAHKAARCLMELELYLRKEQYAESPSELMESPYEVISTEEESLENNKGMVVLFDEYRFHKQPNYIMTADTNIWPGAYR